MKNAIQTWLNTTPAHARNENALCEAFAEWLDENAGYGVDADDCYVEGVALGEAIEAWHEVGRVDREEYDGVTLVVLDRVQPAKGDRRVTVLAVELDDSHTLFTSI